MVEDDFDTFCSNFSKELAVLNPENRSTRKQGLASLKEKILTFSNSKNFPNVMSEPQIEHYSSKVIKPVVEILKSDPVERCRELAAEILQAALSKSEPLPRQACQNLIPIILNYLNGLEQCEEIRLLYLQILCVCLRNKRILYEHPNDDINKNIITTLTFTLLDSYAEALRESCNCLNNFVKNLDEAELNNYSLEPFVKVLLNLLKHRHNKVRSSTITTLGILLQIDFLRLSKYIEEITQNLGQCIATEESALVKEAFAKVIGKLVRDKLCLDYESSYLLRFLPLVLTSLSDPIIEIRNQANELWLQTGERYLEKHEKLFNKDLLIDNKSSDNIIHIRPNLGCRLIVSHHLRGILPAVLKEVNDNWSETTREKSISLLYQLLMHAEDNCLPYLDEIFTSLIKYQANLFQVKNNQIYVEKCKACCEIIGCFVNSVVWSEILIPIITSFEESDAKLLSAGIWILFFTFQSTDISEEIWKKANALLVHPDICQSRLFLVQEPLLNMMECVTVHSQLEGICQEDTYEPFVILTSLGTFLEEPFKSEYDTEKRIKLSLLALTSKLNDNEGDEKCLYKTHFGRLLEKISATHQAWDIPSGMSVESCPELCIFNFINKVTPPPVLANYTAPIIEIVTYNILSKKGPLLKTRFYGILFCFLDSILNYQEPPTLDLNNLFQHLTENIFLPQLKLNTPGMCADSVKAAAVNCFSVVVSGKWSDYSRSFQTPWMESFVERLTPLLANMLESSENALNRSIACRVIGELFKQISLAKAESLTTCWKMLQKSLLNRLELDASYQVRLVSCQSLEIIFSVIYHSELFNFLETKETTKLSLRELETSKTNEQREVLEKLLGHIAYLTPDEIRNHLNDGDIQCVRKEVEDIFDKLRERVKQMQI